MEPPVNVGIVGCGVIGPTHIESYQRLEGVHVTWLCDLVEAKANKRAERYGIPNVTTDVNAMLADPQLQAVSICTDHASHSPIAIAALQAGKHVLCEKALAANREGLDAMLAAHAATPGLVFAGVLQHRFDRVFRYVKDLVSSGELGTLLTCSLQMSCLRTNAYYAPGGWRGTWDREGGSVLINQSIHFLDILDWIGGGVQELSGRWTNLTHADCIETEDTAVVALTFKNGALGTIEATSSSSVLEWDPRLSIRGTDGVVEIVNGRVGRLLFKDKAQEARIAQELEACKDDALIPAAKGYYGEGHPANIADFIAAIREKREPFVTAQQARRVVDMVLAVYESANTGRPVSL